MLIAHDSLDLIVASYYTDIIILQHYIYIEVNQMKYFAANYYRGRNFTLYY